MAQPQQEMSSNQTTAVEGTDLQIRAPMTKALQQQKMSSNQTIPWVSDHEDVLIVDSELSSDDDTKNIEDLTLSTPPIIVKSKPNISLEAIPISPVILDLSLPNDITPISPEILDLSLLNDRTPNYK